MGGLTPIVSGANTVLSTLNTANQIIGTVQAIRGNFGDSGVSEADAGRDLALKQLQERQRLDQALLEQSNALEREKIAAQNAQNAEERRLALRRAVGRQRAKFGGAGISSSGGSSEAVLLGFFDETKDELDRRNQLDQIRNRALELDVSQSNSINLLQSTQLAERNNLARLF